MVSWLTWEACVQEEEPVSIDADGELVDTYTQPADATEEHLNLSLKPSNIWVRVSLSPRPLSVRVKSY